MEGQEDFALSDDILADKSKITEWNAEESASEESIHLSKKEENMSKNSSAIENSFTSEDMIKNSTWELNQLAWARMSVYPFWPCMITNDPNSLMTFQKVQTIGKSKTLMIHVHFFNDNGRHSWIPCHHMIPFNGIEDFRKRASLVTDEMKKKEPKFAAALSVKPNIFGTWQKAVAEAMDVMYDLDLSSLEKFKPQPKSVTKSAPKTNSANKKRKRKEEIKGSKKVFKQTDLENEVNINSDVPKTETESNLSLETPPVSPSIEDDQRTAIFQKQKRITKMINKLQPPDFEVYFERNFYTIKEQHVEATDEQVREYLYDVWENMVPEEKLKYRATYKIDGDS